MRPRPPGHRRGGDPQESRGPRVRQPRGACPVHGGGRRDVRGTGRVRRLPLDEQVRVHDGRGRYGRHGLVGRRGLGGGGRHGCGPRRHPLCQEGGARGPPAVDGRPHLAIDRAGAFDVRPGAAVLPPGRGGGVRPRGQVPLAGDLTVGGLGAVSPRAGRGPGRVQHHQRARGVGRGAPAGEPRWGPAGDPRGPPHPCGWPPRGAVRRGGGQRRHHRRHSVRGLVLLLRLEPGGGRAAVHGRRQLPQGAEGAPPGDAAPLIPLQAPSDRCALLPRRHHACQRPRRALQDPRGLPHDLRDASARVERAHLSGGAPAHGLVRAGAD
mmetsp:Transcript_38929/g.123765  ORF Transcript_38929/g.123765 Transcript_38929/m.123765 type:complete len:323 (+) Transcript_38929:1467-2435(+)